MAAGAYVQLLGQPGARVGGKFIDFLPNKRFQLLAYLAYQNDWVSRDRLAFLFWADETDHTARHNLRQLLKYVRKMHWLGGLEADEQRLRWQAETDVAALREALKNGDVKATLSLYLGPLLPNMEGTGEGEFGDWLAMEREGFHGRWREALLSRAGELDASGEHEQVATLLRSLLERDPLDEEGLQAYMKAAAKAGQQRQALTAYRAFAKRMRAELEMEPASATEQLAKEIEQAPPAPPRRREVAAPVQPLPVPDRSAAVATSTEVAVSLPKPATPFVGRDLELAEVANLLSRDDCRMLTLTGAGGVGKTRLALQAAMELGKNYPDGAYFLPLEALTSPSFIPTALVSVFGLELKGWEEPLTRAIHFLKGKQLLLVLDNFEHLLDGAVMLPSLLQACPHLKLLVSSRERLNLQGEWVFPMEGLAYPEHHVPFEEATAYDAVRLFMQCVSRVAPGHPLKEDAVPLLLRLCQLVEGMPLALELAAGWLQLLPLAEVVAEIEKGLDLLETTTRDLPSRHRSLRAVFDHSWRLLTEGERRALRRLSVFQGGFTREAAAQVADASPPLLLGLSNKSLLRVTASKRFERHPLVRQYCQEQADAFPDELAQTRDRHCAYYAAFLHEQERWMQGGERQKEAYAEVEGEIDNVRAAWRRAIERRDQNALELAREGLESFLYWRGHFKEGEEAFGAAVACLDQDSVTLSKLLVAQGVFAWERRHLDAAQAACEQSIAMLERLKAPPDARAFLHLGIVHVIRKNFDESERLHLEGLTAAKASGDLFALGCNLNQLAEVAAEKGDAEQAERRYLESIAAFRKLQDRRGLTMAIGGLGFLLANTGRMGDAERCYQESLGYAREIGSLPRVAFALTNLGGLVYRQGNFKQAEAYYLESLPIWERLEDPNMVHTLTGLGETAHALQNYRDFLGYFAEALPASLRLGGQQEAVAIVVDVATLLTSMGEEENSFLLLAFALGHRGIGREAKKRAERLVFELQTRMPQPAIAAAQRACQDLTLEKVQKMLGVLAQQVKQHSGIPTG